MVYCQFKVYSPKLHHFPFCVFSLSPANIYIVSLSLYRKHFYSQIFLFSLCLSCKNLITTPPIATSQFKSPERLTHVYLTVFSQNHPSPLTQGTVTCPRLTQPHTQGIVSRRWSSIRTTTVHVNLIPRGYQYSKHTDIKLIIVFRFVVSPVWLRIVCIDRESCNRRSCCRDDGVRMCWQKSENFIHDIVWQI